MAFMDVFSRVVEGIGEAAIFCGGRTAEGDAGLRGQSNHPARQAPGRHPDAQDADRAGLA